MSRPPSGWSCSAGARRLAEPQEVVEGVLYLATATFVTGVWLDISGGNVRDL